MEKNKLSKLQNRAERIRTSSRHDADARPLLNTLGLNTIENLIDTEINTMVFKAFNGLAPEYFSNLFILNSESHLLALRNTSTDLKPAYLYLHGTVLYRTVPKLHVKVALEDETAFEY